MRKTLVLMALILAPALVQAQEEEKKEKKFQILINFGYQPLSASFEETTSFRKSIEDGSTTRAYSLVPGATFEAGFVFSMRPNLALMWSFEVSDAPHDALVEISEPHPLLFNRHRTASSSVDSLEYSEYAVHIGLAYRIALSRLEMDLFAGPSIISAEIELVDKINTSSEYPFDELSVSDVSRATSEGAVFGFNAGAGVTYFVTESFGLSFMARFSRASIDVTREGSEPFALEAGGFRAGGGVRIKF